ncbi:hypothetical protein QJS10_CPA09g01327 [Acorus calamus]|uniref:Uncharacterized protein n=1 Tax=Acorus calamus TaxID=4465 RepID=A0AAV9E3V8_ACOCL|nr:hypothetical protein QJS10_CPA09g01327 [Acorus calamus]
MFTGQIRDFKSEGYIDGKNDRRLDDCLRYSIVSGKKALQSAGLGGADLNKVGTISANRERDIGELIAKAMEKVGKEGVITISDEVKGG